MLFIGSKLHDLPLLSVRSSGRIGTATSPIINPHNLHIDGFYAHAMRGQNEGVLVDIDIREFHHSGLIINDHEDISNPEDLVRLKPVLDINFQLIGKAVYQGKRKIGRVADYTVETKSLFIQKLYVQPALLSGMGTKQLIFDRQSIVEVTDDKIVVSSPEQKESAGIAQKFKSAPSLSSASTSAISK